MPIRGRDKVDEESRQSWFSHQSEEARPYYYSVYLADHDIKAEIAPTERAAIMRFTFPESDESGVVIDAFDRGSYIRVMHDKRTVVGYTTRNSGGVPDNFKNWFIVRFDRKIRDFQIYDGTKPVEGEQLVGEHALVRVGFETRRGEQVTVRAASSFISQMQAVQNLEELGKDDFETVKAKAQAHWDEVLGRIEVEGGTTDQYRTFYSCLYRSTLFPRKFYEIDKNGNILHYSPYNGEVLPGYMYTDTGFWDTFRSLFPLLNLVYPSVNAEIQAGLANAYRESGFLPEWASPGHRGCMVGNNSASVVSDAILKGVTPEEDIATLYEAMLAGRRKVHPTVSSTGRLGHEYYNTLGYIPYDVGINENVARTLEYAYDDWCIAQVAKMLGKDEDAKRLEEASKNFNRMAKRLKDYHNSTISDLMASKRYLETIINSINEPIVGLDNEQIILFINNEALNILNLKREDVIRKSAQEIAMRNDLLRRLICGMWEDKKKEQEAPKSKRESLKIYADNKESYFQVKYMEITMRGNDGVTMEKRGDVIMLKNVTEFQELDTAKTTFISTVSHELKTPISAIMMSLQLLEDKRVGGLNPEQEELSRSIKENSERLLSITGELLNMTQVESGKLQLKPKITKPIELIDYAIKANRVQAEKFGIQVEVDYPEKIGKLFVDSEKIAWVLTNLLSNAVRYSSEAGRVVIGARQQDDNHIAMFVQDFGKGIDPRYHESIFEHYFRVPGTKVQGTGLGLSISRDFVEAHGGTLTVDSELGKGSVFTMVLPC